MAFSINLEKVAQPAPGVVRHSSFAESGKAMDLFCVLSGTIRALRDKTHWRQVAYMVVDHSKECNDCGLVVVML